MWRVTSAAIRSRRFRPAALVTCKSKFIAAVISASPFEHDVHSSWRGRRASRSHPGGTAPVVGSVTAAEKRVGCRRSAPCSILRVETPRAAGGRPRCPRRHHEAGGELLRPGKVLAASHPGRSTAAPAASSAFADGLSTPRFTRCRRGHTSPSMHIAGEHRRSRHRPARLHAHDEAHFLSVRRRPISPLRLDASAEIPLPGRFDIELLIPHAG